MASEDYIDLRCRNAGLETELRLVKEQLAIAHQSTPFLVGRFQIQNDLLQRQVNDLTRENASLKEKLNRRTPPRRKAITGVRARQSISGIGEGGGMKAQSRFFPNQSSFTRSENKSSDQTENSADDSEEEVDLLDLEDDEYSPTTFGSATMVNTPSDGLGSSGVSKFGSFLPTPESGKVTQPLVGLGMQVQDPFVNGIAIRNVDGSTSIIKPSQAPTSLPIQPLPFTESAVLQRSRQPWRNGQQARASAFLDSDRQRLLNAACFTEELPEEELESFWEGYAKEHGRVSGPEWRRYYEVSIRPAYLDRQARLAEQNDAKEEDLIPDIQAETNKSYEQGISDIDVKDERLKVEAEHEEQKDSGEAVEVPEGQAQESLHGGTENPEITKQQNLVQAVVNNHESKGSEDVAQNVNESHSYGSSFDTSEIAVQVDAEPEKPAVHHSGSSLFGSPQQLAAAREFAQRATRGGERQRPGGRPAVETNINLEGLPAIPIRSETGTQGDMNTPDLYDATEYDAQQYAQEKSRARLSPETTLSRPITPRAPRAAGDGSAQTSRFFGASRYRGSQGEIPWQDKIFFQRGSEEQRLRRTVLIGNVPANISLGEVLDHVHGGMLLHVQYLVTADMRTTPPLQTNTVLLTFQTADGANRYSKYCAECPFGFEDSDGTMHKTQVSLVSTPTRPSSGRLLEALRIKATRVIFMQDYHKQLLPEMIAAILCENCECAPPVRLGYDKDGVMFLEFAGVVEAADALWAAKGCPELKDVDGGFLMDPCERMVEGEGEAEGE